MSFILTISLAHALTLQEAVERAAEVDPDAVVAELEWRQARLDATGAWSSLGVTPSASVTRRYAAGTVADSSRLQLGIGALDASAWFGAARESAQARTARDQATATSLDAQYAVAALYFEVLAADAGLAAARETERYATATADATAARVKAGLESELAARSARLGLLQAQAGTAQAEADLSIARASLGRALQQDLGTLEPASLPDLPAEAGRSPWIDAAASDLAAARLEHAEALAGLLPTGSLAAESSFATLNEWAVSVGATWTFDGVIGPFLRARDAAYERDIAEVELDATERDFALYATVARERAAAASRVAEAARARESLAEESLEVGQARLAVGLASSLEVLRLQDEAASARADRVQAELAEATARLEARRVAGLRW